MPIEFPRSNSVGGENWESTLRLPAPLKQLPIRVYREVVSATGRFYFGQEHSVPCLSSAVCSPKSPVASGESDRQTPRQRRLICSFPGRRCCPSRAVLSPGPAGCFSRSLLHGPQKLLSCLDKKTGLGRSSGSSGTGSATGHGAVSNVRRVVVTVNRPPQQPAQPRYGNYWAPLTDKWHPTQPAKPRHTSHWAPRTRKRHQQEHRLQRPTQRSDPTQHAKGRTGDCPGPRAP